VYSGDVKFLVRCTTMCKSHLQLKGNRHYPWMPKVCMFEGWLVKDAYDFIRVGGSGRQE
jgi:hypothetical protein